MAADAAATTQRLVDLLTPDGAPVGEAGSSPWIRELSGGVDAAEQWFQNLTQGGIVDSESTYPGTGYTMPDDSFIGYRSTSSDGETPTIDVNISPIWNVIRKLKFPLDGGE